MSLPDRSERRPSAAEGAGTRDTAATKRRLTSRDLLAGRDEVIIEHAGQEYHLRHTRTGKLILTK
ncbi:MAG: hemin uptake protein HemP [Beggiatoa sp.]|jgi:hemin uptake protein HemP|nr:hemin uptake protein HemP [Beggiatoa sp.]